MKESCERVTVSISYSFMSTVLVSETSPNAVSASDDPDTEVEVLSRKLLRDPNSS